QSEAASEQTWDDAKTFLPDDEHDRWRFADDSPSCVGYGHQDLLDALAPTDDPRMLGRLGPFEIAGVIGAGGMGVVLKAFDPALSRFVALKALSPHLWSDRQARERFAREARAAASVVHENVIEIYGVSESNGVPFFTMPYLRGETLQQRIGLRGALITEEVLRISTQLAEALAAAHAQGLLHRDIKPSNVLLTDGSERVRLSDFGLVHSETEDHITHTGMITGTPRYMSPEQVRGVKLDHRSDLFSLGTLIYEMCCGQCPFAADSVIEQLMKISAANPKPLEEVNPAVPTWLAAIVDRLHRPDPSDRYDSARELAEDLQQCLASVQNPDNCLQPRAVTRLEIRYLKAKRSRKVAPALKLIGLGVVAIGLAALSMWIGGMMMLATIAPASLRGRVIDSQGKPVANSPVLAIEKTWPGGRYQQRSLKTVTDQDGWFEFEKFGVRGQHYEFLLTTLPRRHTMASVYREVKDGSPQRPIDLKVVPAQPVKVELVDSTGTALAGARLFPLRRVTASGQEHSAYPAQFDDGAVKCSAEGEVSLSAFLPGEKATLAIEYQGEVLQRQVTVPRSRRVRLRLPLTASGADKPSRGRVTDASGAPIENAKILIIHKSWPGGRYQQRPHQTKTDAKGEFRFPMNIDNGNRKAFLVSVLAQGHEMQSLYHTFEPGDSITHFDFQLAATDPIKLRFVDPAGQPLAQAAVSFESRHDGQKEHLIYSMSRAAATWRTNADGWVSMSVFAPGDEVSLVVSADDGPPIKVEATIDKAKQQTIVVKKK
ncbi:MAG: protein kinase, partial [Pirellulales bacterium]|nr:protein kinase [Pirellulales bacterium]